MRSLLGVRWALGSGGYAGSLASEKFPGYPDSMLDWQMLGGAVASRRIAAIIVIIAAILIAAGCGPEKTPPPEVSGRPVVIAAGDIADCATEDDEATAGLVGGIEGTILTLGDHAYESGTSADFAECYDPYWGRFKARTRPSPGNHEYETAGASGYFDYFGAAAGDPDKGYYSYDLGSWHLVALNSNCEEIRCDPGSPQGRWLEEDLAANDEVACTLAYFHHPLFTSGEYRPGIKRVEHLWEILYDAGVDVVLNGHDHNYQRFAPQDPQGRADPEAGIRQFVVGTGGRGLYQIPHPIANAEVYDDNTHGVLELTLHPKRYDWEFVPVEGETFSDSGVARCH
jgi:hypothetical protein